MPDGSNSAGSPIDGESGMSLRFKPIEERVVEHLEAILNEKGFPRVPLILDVPSRPELGDLSTNLALQLSKKLKTNPSVIAEEIAREFPTSSEEVSQVEVAGPGFLNFRLGVKFFHRLLAKYGVNIEEIGKSEEGAGRRVLFEYVSANPTGPLNIVSARAGSVGDTLVRVFRHRGYQAESEYYINDTGRQVGLFGASVRARLAELEGRESEATLPPDGYYGDYVYDVARQWRAAHPEEDYPREEAIGTWAVEYIIERQRRSLAEFRVSFNRWFRESELHRAGKPQQVIERLSHNGLTYHKDGALFFRASQFGDSEDRVLVTSDGRFTYRLPDIAYHLDKWQRGYEVAVTLLGPDHHGHIGTIKAALKALGLPDDFYQAIIVQQVNLKRGEEEVKMSKRAGVIVTLEDLIEEVGVDAARLFFLLRRVSSPLDFDLDLARKHSEDNPVYYLQYAHARIASIFRQPQVDGLRRDLDLLFAKPMGQTDINGGEHWDRLTQGEERLLLRHLSLFSWTLSSVVRSFEPHILVLYLLELARLFHLFYQRHRVISPDRSLTLARLGLCKVVGGVLKRGLDLVGVEAPERM